MQKTLPTTALDRWRHAAIACGLAAALLTLVSLAAPVRAVSELTWSVLAVSGDASWRPAAVKVGGWQELQANAQIPDGAEIRTGGNGSAVVAKSLDRIEIRANTSVVVAASVSSNATQMYQSSGSATYTVEKRPAGTFSVRTPYVLAVVKGTKFDVDITNRETSVSVSEGRVGVSDQRSNDNVDVTPGERARARAESPGIDVGRSSASPAAPATKAASGGVPGSTSTPSEAPAGNAKGSPAGTASKGLDTAVEAVGKTAGESSGVVGDSVEAAGNVVGGAVDTARGAVGGVAGALGGGSSNGDSGGGGSGGGGSGGGDSGSGDSGGGSGGGGSGGGDSGGGSSGGGDSGGGGSGGGGSGGGASGGGGLGGLGDRARDAVGGLL